MRALIRVSLLSAFASSHPSLSSLCLGELSFESLSSLPVRALVRVAHEAQQDRVGDPPPGA